MKTIVGIMMLMGCAAPVDPNREPVVGRADDPTFCVNTEQDGRRYTADNAPPNDAQKSAGVMQGRYPYPVSCEFIR